MGRSWTSKELDFLKSNYENMSDLELSIRLERTEKAVSSKLGALKLNRGLKNSYTLEDRELIMSGDYTREEIADRYFISVFTVRSMEKSWGFKCKKNKRYVTEEEKEFVRSNKNLKNKALSIRLGCTVERVSRVKHKIKSEGKK